MSAKSAEMLAWLASSENRDAELRAKAKDVLDKLCMIEQIYGPKRP